MGVAPDTGEACTTAIFHPDQVPTDDAPLTVVIADDHA
jgi:hypothetical protein